jgi:predicted nucleotidyltransferase
MKRPHITKKYALSVIEKLTKQLEDQDAPLVNIFLFGSAAQNKTHEWSDIDIAIVCQPFLSSKYDERRLFNRTARKIDVRAEVVCLHPQDFENRYFTLAKEVQRHGIPSATNPKEN